MKKKVLITGITGQDGSYLLDLLLNTMSILDQYEVHGLVRRVAAENPETRLSRIHKHLSNPNLILHGGSLESYSSVFNLVEKVRPDECYHLAAQSFVALSFEDQFATMDINMNGTHHLLSALQQLTPHCKFYFAGSSEMFGNALESPQDESTPFGPVSIYGISKLIGYHLAGYYRNVHDMEIYRGILFNHESPRRGMEFVTRKITHAVASISMGIQKELKLGDIDVSRDWGHANSYVEAMYMMIQSNSPDDYVIATGKTHTVREFVRRAFATVGLNYHDYVIYDKTFTRPSEIYSLVGDSSKAEKQLNWKNTIEFQQLVEEMVISDVHLVKMGVNTKGALNGRK